MTHNKLTAFKVDILSATGRYADGAGLYLNISNNLQNLHLCAHGVPTYMHISS